MIPGIPSTYCGPSVAAAMPGPSGPSIRAVLQNGQTGGNAPTLPTHATGDTLVFGFWGSMAPLAGTGWTRQIAQDDSGLTSTLAVYTKQAASSSESNPFSINPTGDYLYAGASVQNPATGYDVSASGNGTGTNIIAPTITTTASNDVLLSFYGAGTNASIVVVPAPQANGTNVQQTRKRLARGTETLSASGATGTRTATCATSSDWCAANVAVK